MSSRKSKKNRADIGIPEHPRVCGYLRVSKAREEMMSPEIQRSQIRDLCARRRWDIPENGWFQDISHSGRSVDRPEFQRMLGEAMEGKWDVIVVYALSRFGRTVSDCLDLIKKLESRNIFVVSVKEAEIDPSSAMGQSMRQMMLVFAELESNLISERIVDAHQQLAEEGRWHGGHPPYGYRYADKKLVVDPQEAVVVELVFSSYLGGLNMQEIARTLQQRANEDSAWRPRKLGSHWSHAQVASILQGAHYVGRLRTSRGLTEKSEFIQPLIPEEEWLAAQELRALRQRQPHLGKPSKRHPIPGRMVRCSGCGFAMTIKEGKRGYPYYVCSQRTVRACGKNNAIRVPLLEQYVEPLLLKRLRKIQSLSSPQRSKKRSDQSRGLMEILAERDKVEEQLGRLVIDKYDELLTQEEWSSARAVFLERLERLKGESERAAKALRPTTSELDAVWRQFGALIEFSWPTLSAAEKRAVYEGLIHEIRVFEKDEDPRIKIDWRK